MNLTPELKFYIKEYFNPAYRHSEGQWKGFWLPGFKEPTVKQLIDHCNTIGYGIFIVPGEIYLSTGIGDFKFTKSNWWIGRRLPIKKVK